MIVPPPSVVEDLAALVEETRGQNTVISMDTLVQAVDSGAWFVVAAWLSGYTVRRKQALAIAMRACGCEPHTVSRRGAINSWRVPCQ